MPAQASPDFTLMILSYFTMILMAAGLFFLAIAYYYTNFTFTNIFVRNPTDNLKSKYTTVISYSIGILLFVIFIFRTYK